MITSIGSHTFSIYKNLTTREARLLYQTFKNYDEVYIIPPRDNDNMLSDEMKRLIGNYPKYFNIKYHKFKGISWVLKFDRTSYGRYSMDEMKPCSIKATINPKLLAGIVDYVTAADASYLNRVVTNFNMEAASISPLLENFHMYRPNRIDYCINFDLQELEIGCSPEKMMTLIKRSNIPSNMEEWTKYNEISHRKKTRDNFYLQNDSINVNCYGKYAELEEDFDDCPNMEDAKHVVRFEIQCKYPKVYSMSKIIKTNSGFSHNILNEMLSDEVSEDVIKSYYNRIIGKGDYYTLELARRTVESSNFKIKKIYRLIDALEVVNKCRGISKAMDTLQGKELEDFKRSLKELAYIGINPVTIPKEWNIKHIPNLMTAYCRKIEDQQAKEYLEQQR